MEYRNVTITAFRTLFVPTYSPPPVTPPAPSTPTVMDELAKMPPGLWAVIFVVVVAAIGAAYWFLFLKNKTGENRGLQVEKGKEKEQSP
jgi:hypothetical protein